MSEFDSAASGAPDGTSEALFDDVRAKLVLAVQRTPHFLPDRLSLVAIAALSGDEAHAPDCPGCAVTEALVLLQETTKFSTSGGH